MMLKYKRYLPLAAWIVSLLVISSILGYLTRGDVDFWYETLNRSALTPPNVVFSIVWPILYVMIAVAGWMIYTAKSFKELPAIKALFAAQLLLNWAWMPIFFGFHYIGLGLACLFMILAASGALLALTYERMPKATMLLAPYFAWLCFATYLNFYIWQYN